MLKIFFKNIIWLVLSILVAGNIFIFVSGMKLANEINFYEREIKKLHRENTELTTKISQLNSLQFAASIAGQLNFVKKSQPIYLESLKYAYKN